MRAVKGSLVASKPVSLSKAAAIISRFADSGSCSRRDVSAYIRRASAAFDELVLAHREIRVSRKRSELSDAEEPRKKKRKSRVEDVEGITGKDSAQTVSSGFGLVRCGVVDRSEDDSGGGEGIKKKKMKLADAEGQRRVLFPVKDENVPIPDGDPVGRGRKNGYEAPPFGGIGAVGSEETNKKRAKEKKKKEKNPDADNNGEKNDLAGLHEENAGPVKEEKRGSDGKRTKEGKKRDKKADAALVETERHGREEEGEMKKVILLNREIKESKVNMEEERHANDDKKKGKNKKLKEGNLEELHEDEDRKKRKNKENKIDSIEEKTYLDHGKKMGLNIDQKEKGNSEETLHSVEDKKRKREAEHQEEDTGKRRKKKKMTKD